MNVAKMIPTRIFVFLVFYLCSIAIISTDHFATYIPGEVRHTECTDMPYLDYTITRSHLTCSSWCSSKSECIRYMFCNSKDTNGGRCFLFGTSQDCLSTSPGHSCICRIKKSVQDSINGNCTCYAGFHGLCCENVIQDCQEALGFPELSNELTKPIFVQPPQAQAPFEVICFFGGQHVATLMSIRRSVNCLTRFDQNWELYKVGFGTLTTNYFIGLEKIVQLLSVPGRVQGLQLSIGNGSSICAIVYKGFQLSTESSNYTLTLSKVLAVTHIPICSESLKQGSVGRPFSTYDHYSGAYDCPNKMHSGWWFADDATCTTSNLHGPMDSPPYATHNPDFDTSRITMIEIDIITIA